MIKVIYHHKLINWDKWSKLKDNIANKMIKLIHGIISKLTQIHTSFLMIISRKSLMILLMTKILVHKILTNKIKNISFNTSELVKILDDKKCSIIPPNKIQSSFNKDKSANKKTRITSFNKKREYMDSDKLVLSLFVINNNKNSLFMILLPS